MLFYESALPFELIRMRCTYCQDRRIPFFFIGLLHRQTTWMVVYVWSEDISVFNLDGDNIKEQLERVRGNGIMASLQLRSIYCNLNGDLNNCFLINKVSGTHNDDYISSQIVFASWQILNSIHNHYDWMNTSKCNKTAVKWKLSLASWIPKRSFINRTSSYYRGGAIFSEINFPGEYITIISKTLMYCLMNNNYSWSKFL